MNAETTVDHSSARGDSCCEIHIMLDHETDRGSTTAKAQYLVTYHSFLMTIATWLDMLVFLSIR
jgi:hypothetical protein